MTVPYLGPGWGKKALAAMRSDPRVAAAVKGLRLGILTVIEDPPEGRYGWLYARFEDGFAQGQMGHPGDAALQALPKPTITIRGPYKVFAAIQRGELTERRAVLGGQLHVSGSRLFALRHMGSLETVTEVLAEIPCET